MGSIKVTIDNLSTLMETSGPTLSVLSVAKTFGHKLPFSFAQFIRYPIVAECHFAPGHPREFSTGLIQLPGELLPQTRTYAIVNGMAVIQGGIILGPAEQIARDSDELGQLVSHLPADMEIQDFDRDSDPESNVDFRVLAVKSADKLWDDGQVPFVIDEGFNRGIQTGIQNAINHLHTHTNIRFTPASRELINSFPQTGGYIFFTQSSDPGVSSAGSGRDARWPTVINIWRSHDWVTIVHEICHALGLMHEQSRNDRDEHVTIHWENIENLERRKHNFDKEISGHLDVGQYDYRSVMHYTANSFGEVDQITGLRKLTITPTDPSVTPFDLGRGSPTGGLTRLDIQGLRRLYPFHREMEGGQGWGSRAFTTDLAFGDVDGDGRQELVVARHNDVNARYLVMDDADTSYREIWPNGNQEAAGNGWGDSNFATACACADIDGDGRDEVIIGRKAGTNMRFEIIDDAVAGFRQLVSEGAGWGSDTFVTSVSMAVDHDGTPLIGVARNARKKGQPRFWVYKYDSTGKTLHELLVGGMNWGDQTFATGIAFGDVDGDGWLEVGVTRFASKNARWLIHNGVRDDFRLMHEGGADWGPNAHATAIAFGDIDGDGVDEIGIARKHHVHGRWFLFDDFNHQFRGLHEGGSGWGRGYWATDIAFGDVNGDGISEVVVCRHSDKNGRYFVFSNSSDNFRLIAEGGRTWGKDVGATCVSLGDPAGTGIKNYLAVGRISSKNARFIINRILPT